MFAFSLAFRRNETDSGLRMKITSVPKTASGKSDSSTIDTNANRKTLKTDSITSKESVGGRKTMRNEMSKKPSQQDTTSNSSCCSDCTESEDDSDSSSMCSKNKNASKSSKQNATNNKLSAKNTSNFQRRNITKRNSNQQKRIISSDSDSSDESSDCEPIEKRSSPVKSKPSYKNDFFLTASMAQNKNLQVVDGAASSSDMELPDLVSAAIQRVESCSEEENAKSDQNNKTQYTSSLLRDFVAKTQMMGSSFSSSNHIAMSKDDQKKSNDDKSNHNNDNHDNVNDTSVKKKRGRPRKNPILNTNQAASTVHNGSPDSGITSTPQSPNPSGKSGSSKVNKKSSAAVGKKIDISSLEKNIYATERVLYPPRRKRQVTTETHQQNSDTHSENYDNHSVERVDPVWRQIDINKKFRRPSGYRSDTNNITCSKVLAAQSGYTSDYCNVNRHLFSGYKSDYSCKSRRSGYKSDYSVKAKSCGYRSDCSTRHRRKIRRKRRTKTTSTAKPTINDQDILLLAGLSLGQSDDSSLDSGDKPQIMSKPSSTPRNSSISNNALKKSVTAKVSASKLLGDDFFSTNGSDRTPKHKSSSNFESLLLSMNGPLQTITSSIYKDGGDSGSIKLDRIKPGLIRRRRSSAVSHCSSHCSNSSRHPFRRRRRRRLKSITEQLSEPNLVKMNQEIDVLSTSFSSMCSIFSDKLAREKDKTSQTTTTAAATNKSASSRRTGKKRKTNQETSEVPITNATTTSKRRNKKTVQTKSPDDHKLPLKKRHYLLTPGEKGEHVEEKKVETQNEADA